MPPQNSERAPLLSGDNHQNYSQNQNNPFKFSAKDLGDLIDPKNPDKLREYGDVDGILSALKTDVKKGISKDENLNTHANGEGESSPFESRISVFGKNVMPEVPQQTLLELIWEAYQDKTLVLLSIAALVSLAVGLYEDSLKGDNGEPKVGWVEGVAIFIAVVVVVLTNSINDYQKEKQFRKLNAKKEDRTVKLIRDGREENISVFDVQVGDILLLEPGDIVPTDGVYIEGHHLVCDESSATGESDAIKKGLLKDNMDPFILSGSKVQEGVARVVVIAIGIHSFHGKTMMAMRDGGDNVLTPLQIKLDYLAESIAKLGMAAALIMLFTLSLKYWIIALVNDQIPEFAEGFAVMVKIVIQAITIVVVAVPEGLPMAVTLALAFATTQMIKDNNLVRILAACETMGNATVICTDKTGTLTQNLMTVVQGIIAGTSMDGTPNPKDFKRKLADPVLKLLIEGISVNSSAFEGKDENGKVDFVGSKTEVALLNFGVNMGEDVKSPRDNRKVALVYPFASKNKSMSTVIETPDSDTPYRQYTKGASEIVLEACTHYLDGDGKVQVMDQTTRDNYLRNISRFAHQALRTICLAYRDVSNADFESFNPEQAPLEHLVVIGIVGIEDPLRDGVVESVAECRRAGVYVKMITGDNVETAKAIAKKAGIWSPGGVVISGPEFRRLSPEEQSAIVPRLQVLARSSPTDKQIVVRTLQNLHDVVAMTGDGTNDGPALKMADVGFSMGIAGTEVAKEASAIILMDDNFNSIIKALRWGRAVNSGVRKFLQFQLTVNITAVIVAFVSAVISETNESVLTAVQLLWVNLIMDTLAALALATEPPTSDILDTPPIPRNAPLITFKMWKHILGQAFFQIAINLIFMFLGERLIPGREHEVVKTVVFNSFVFLQIFNELNCRRINDEFNIFSDIFNNWIFLAVQAIVIFGQIILVNYGGAAFSTVPLNAVEWTISVVIGALSLPIGFILRLLPDLGDDSTQVHKPIVSRERMMLESAIQDVSSKLKVYAALRHKPRRSTGGSRMKSVSSLHE